VDKIAFKKMSESEEVTAAELAEIITELQKYRDRLVHDTTEAIQKARLPKAKAMAQMEPELIKIDAMMQELHQRHVALLASN
jgi:rubrerythrin